MITKMLRAFSVALLIVFASVNCKKLMKKRMINEDESVTNEDTTRVKKVSCVLY
jgi:hypothetical protein